ncbi:hypothetical protein QYF61_013870 [Mycteria americana]|uniref:Uncharacterized protein n=1 Tax=Mycteria americana TaxID=33587 RepID=A0AAN7RKL5_MYCAM|nr:hypothetical protein QYF61_013870 [Mycteria americana]
MQGFADGNVVIIGHDGEKKILPSNQEEKEKDLGSTSSIGNGPGVPEGIGHGFGDSSGDGAQAKEGEVEEEEVHVGVEAVVAGYGGDDEDAAQKGRQVPKGCLQRGRRLSLLKEPMEKTRGNGYKLHQEKFHVDIRKTFFRVRTIIQWDNLLWDVRDIVQACRERAGKAKAQVELNLGRDVQGNKKGFYKNIGGKREVRENVGLPLDKAGDL